MSQHWDVLITNELLDKIRQSVGCVPLQGVIRDDDRLAVVTSAGGEQEQIGWASATSIEATREGLWITASPGGLNRAFFNPNQVETVKLHPYADSQRFARLEDILDVKRLRKSVVTLVGCGAVGSEMARYLASAGVERFYLADCDFLLPVNLPRHAGDVRDLFRRKCEVVKDVVRFRSPSTDVDTFHGDITNEGYEWLVNAVRQSDLVIATTDSNAAQATTNAVCVSNQTPFLSCGVWEQAFGGEVFWAFPVGSKQAQIYGATPCFHCVFGSVRLTQDEPERKPQDAPCVVLTTGEPGIGIDLAFTSQVALAVSVAILDPSPARRVLLENKSNLIYCHSGQANRWLGQFKGPFDVQYKSVTFNRECPVCGGSAAAMPSSHPAAGQHRSPATLPGA